MKKQKLLDIKASWQSVFLIGLIIISIGIFGALKIEKHIKERTKQILSEKIEEQKKSLAMMTNGLSAEEFLSLSEKLDQATKTRILWSNVAETILKLETNGVIFKSFSATKDQKISIQGNAPSIQNVLFLVETLKRSPEKIKNPFLSGFSEVADGKISFQISFDLIK